MNKPKILKLKDLMKAAEKEAALSETDKYDGVHRDAAIEWAFREGAKWACKKFGIKVEEAT
jgi:hypothetical protein